MPERHLMPRRGSKTNARIQNFVLKEGEIFLEYPNGNMGNEPGRIVIGNDVNNYQSLDYGTTSTNKFQPFITDPSIYVPRFTNSTPQSSNYTYDPATNEIIQIGDGSETSTSLPEAIGKFKEVLCKHANSFNYFKNKFEEAAEELRTVTHDTADNIKINYSASQTHDTGTADYYLINNEIYYDLQLSGYFIDKRSDHRVLIHLPFNSSARYTPMFGSFELYYCKEDGLSYIDQGTSSVIPININNNIKCIYDPTDNTIKLSYRGEEVMVTKDPNESNYDYYDIKIRGYVRVKIEQFD